MSDPEPRPPEPAPRPEPRPPGPSLRVSLLLMLLGALLAVPTAVAGTVPIVRTFTSSHRVAVPGGARLHLDRGRYTVYEETGRASFGSSFAPDDSTTISPADVTVVDASGANVVVFDRGATTETLTDNGDRFVGAVRFDVPAGGYYTITVRTATSKSVLVARSLGSSVRAALKWFALTALGGLVFVTGLVLLIVGAARRSRARNAAAYAYTSVATPAPGWYPDPWASGRLRYWDGARWTEHLH